MRLPWASPLPPFRSMNSVVIGWLTIGAVVALLVGALDLSALSLSGGGTGYAAAFSEAAGLASGDDVRIAGVSVGRVTGVTLERTHVRVGFTSSRHFGDATTATIEISTLLGNKYLALHPGGAAPQSSRAELPLARTTAPYDVEPAFGKLTTTIQAIDTSQLAQAFTTLAATFTNTPPEVGAALTGLSRLSQTIASRDDQLSSLLNSTAGLSSVLAGRKTQVTALVNDGNLLLQEVSARRAVIHQLLVDTAALSRQLTGLVADTGTTIGPALRQLDSVLAVLTRDQNLLDTGVRDLVPFTRQLLDVVGNGEWFEGILQNLAIFLPPGASPAAPAGSTAAPSAGPRTLAGLLGAGP